MYLGNKLNNRASVKEEIKHQMQQVTITWKRLHVYWRATNASKKWQLLAYDAIVKSKLLYGLETAQVSRADLKKLMRFRSEESDKYWAKNTHIGTEERQTMSYSTWQAGSSAKATRVRLRKGITEDTQRGKRRRAKTQKHNGDHT